ncbi:MAG TPA: serine protease, partial [Magnetospirillum sp.]|nr:serine protease [Magnetospirillum sp.]
LPPPAQGDAQVLTRQDLVDRLHHAVVLVIAEKDTGSGFFVTPDTVVTNNHVVASAKNGQVMVVGRGLDAPRPARVVARTKSQGQNERDYAILRVEGAQVATTLPLELQAGELSNVVAAGFPGLLLDTDMNFRALIRGDMKAMPELAMSQGAVMAVQNRDRGLPVIAHSAPISGGNSGGPLVDMCGRVLGINTFINVAVQQASSAGFALAANDLADYLRANGVKPEIASGACNAK